MFVLNGIYKTKLMTTINKSNFIFLDRNENQYGPAPACLKILRNSDHLLGTYSRDFSRGIKSILSERLAYDFGTEEKKILLGYGSEDILKQVVQCYLNDIRITLGTHSQNNLLLKLIGTFMHKKIRHELVAGV